MIDRCSCGATCTQVEQLEAEVEKLKAELAAQEVSRQTYYSEWEERAKKQQAVIDTLREKFTHVSRLHQELWRELNT